ncbi:MAG TPA: patatin-like phospholipase family protein [Candidatus Omnitrophota bacterium]|nr:patatin-like phospholipase family protein [Candidatus Omnitrophota bacterium]
MANLSTFVNKFNLVKQIPIFSKLSWFETQKIARKSVVVEHKKGELIAKEGAPPDFLYCLVSGRVQAYTMTAGGIKENVEFIHRGMHFGIISLLTGENHSLNFEAINDSVILKIPRDDFQKFFKSIPQLGLELSQSLSQRVRKQVTGSKSIFESHIISVYSPVVGTGSSTYAINLALSLQRETRKKVIFVNIASSRQEREEKEGVKINYPVWKKPAARLNEIVEDQDKIFTSIVKNDLAIDLLNVSFDPSDEAAKKQIAIFVSALVGDYHYVIVDLPNHMDDVVVETLTQSDLVHLLTFDRRKDLDLIKHVLSRLKTILKENFRAQRIRVVIRGIHDKIYLSFEEINKYIEYDVYASLPRIYKAEEQVQTCPSIIFLTSNEQSDYAKLMRRVSREIGGVLVGLVLGGGAALGVAHIGVLRVLERENILVDVVVGSSMGALVAAIWAVGRSAQEVEQVAREFEDKKALLKLFDPVIPVSGLIGGRLIKHWLRKHLGTKTFYSTKIPLKIIAYDLIQREEIIINSGSLVDAVRKSIAIPGVMEPVIDGERVIIDGGVLNPLPVNVLTGLGIKKIIAINVLQSPEDVSAGHEMEKQQQKELTGVSFLKSPLQYLGFLMSKGLKKLLTPNISDIIVRTLQASEFVIAEQSSHQADVVIHPDLVGINWFELNKVDQLVAAGEKAAVEALADIKKLIEE